MSRLPFISVACLNVRLCLRADLLSHVCDEILERLAILFPYRIGQTIPNLVNVLQLET